MIRNRIVNLTLTAFSPGRCKKPLQTKNNLKICLFEEWPKYVFGGCLLFGAGTWGAKPPMEAGGRRGIGLHPRGLRAGPQPGSRAESNHASIREGL